MTPRRCPLDATREALDALPPLDQWHRQRLLGAPPRWLAHDDPFHKHLRQRERLLEEGDLVWGFVCRANDQLWEQNDGGEWVLPGTVLHGDDELLDHAPHRLEWVSQGVAELAASAPCADPVGRRVQQAIEDPQSRSRWVPLPRMLTDGLTVHLSALLITRADLPRRHLATPYVPLLVDEELGAVMILPSALRAPDLERTLLELSL